MVKLTCALCRFKEASLAQYFFNRFIFINLQLDKINAISNLYYLIKNKKYTIVFLYIIDFLVIKNNN